MNGYTELEITIRGETEPNASVKVSNLPENPTVSADAEGHFEVVVGLLPGSNVVQLVATDPTTEPPVRDGGAHDHRRHGRGRQPIRGTDRAEPRPAGRRQNGPRPGADLGHRAAGRRGRGDSDPRPAAVASFAVTDEAGQPVAIQAPTPSAPDPLKLTADGSGAFGGELALGPGEWRLRVSATAGIR